MAFSDGRKIAATLDRNGLRPARYIVTVDNTILWLQKLVFSFNKRRKYKNKWRLQPGKCSCWPWGKKNNFRWWIKRRVFLQNFLMKSGLTGSNSFVKSEDLKLNPSYDFEKLLNLQQCFGYSKEDIKFFSSAYDGWWSGSSWING